MPNILLTNYCNRNCPYCFAKDKVELDTIDPLWEMPESDFSTILTYLKPGHDWVSLLGGEPTLHSRFKEIVYKSTSLGYRVKIFTNGTTARLREISAFIPDQSINIILNLNEIGSYRPDELDQIEKNCYAFRKQLSLSFNIYSPDFTWNHIKEIILKHSIKPSVRIGITQPIKGASNLFLLEKDMRVTCRRLVDLAEDLAVSGINIGFDCGFRLCLFTPSERSILAECGTEFLFVCSPILDIGPDLMVWRCFPFSGEACVKLTDYDSLISIQNHFDKQWETIQSKGNTYNCASCSHRMNGVCNGGCLSRTLLVRKKDDMP